MGEHRSLSHRMWECKHQVVFIRYHRNSELGVEESVIESEYFWGKRWTMRCDRSNRAWTGQDYA